MFKIGDKVIINPEANFDEYPYLDGFTLEDSYMAEFIGKQAIIIDSRKRTDDRDVYVYNLNVDEGKYSWSGSWLIKDDQWKDLLNKEEVKRLQKINSCLL